MSGAVTERGEFSGEQRRSAFDQVKALTCMGKPGMGSREDDWLMTSGPLSILVWFGSCREMQDDHRKTSFGTTDQINYFY